MTLEQLLGSAPPARPVPGARQTLREGLTAGGRRLAVIDDDPTGTQTAHEVWVATR